MKTNDNGSRLAIGIALAALIAAALGCSGGGPPAAEGVRPVKMMVVTAGDDLRVRTFPGTVEASRRAELAFRVPGLLLKLPIKEGQKVAAGDLIAQLRQDEFKARLASLQGQLDQARSGLTAVRMGERPEELRRREAQVRAAEARLVNARADVERYRPLLAQRVILQQQFDRAESVYRVAQEEFTAAQELLQKGTMGREEDVEALEAQVRGLEASVVETTIQLKDSSLLAPFDGVIARRFVEEGQNVTANQKVVEFQDVDEIDIAVDVPESVMAADIQLSEIVQLAAELSAAPGVEFPVRIREIAQVADPVTQTFKVRVAMESPPNLRVLPGMTARVTIGFKRASVLGSRILVPVSAVSKQDSGAQVAWVIGPEQTVAQRPVKIGEAQGGQIEILDGLAPGDRIAVAGVRFLRDGMQVRDLAGALGGAQP